MRRADPQYWAKSVRGRQGEMDYPTLVIDEREEREEGGGGSRTEDR